MIYKKNETERSEQRIWLLKMMMMNDENLKILYANENNLICLSALTIC